MMRLPWFDFRAPRTIAEAAKILAAEGPRAMLIAGGTDLVPNMKRRHQTPATLVSLRGVQELRKMNGSLGAALTLTEIVESPRIRERYRALWQAAAQIATPHLRNMGTLGGSLANNDPAADYPAAVLGLGATVVTNKRKIAADEFFKGMFETALGRQEVLTEIRVPAATGTYLKHVRRAQDRATVVVAGGRRDGRVDGGGRVGGCGERCAKRRQEAVPKILVGCPAVLENQVGHQGEELVEQFDHFLGLHVLRHVRKAANVRE